MNENKLDLNAIRKRAEAATPETWKVFPYLMCGTYEVAVGDFETSIASEIAHKADAEFIAHARQDVPALIAEVERLQKALEDIVSVDGKYIYRGSDADDAFDIAREALEHGEKV